MSLLCSFLLSGCATEQNVPLADNFWHEPKQKIAVATVKPPQPTLYKTGAQGLLDVAISSAVTNKFDHCLKTTDLAWYNEIKANFVQQLKQKHMSATYCSDCIDEQKDYSTFAVQNGSDKVLVVKLLALGAIRPYYGFIPLGPPKTYCVLHGELINTQTHQTLWRYQVDVSQPVNGDWDQPPDYPNFTQALKVTIDTAQQQLLDNFFARPQQT